MIHKITQSDIDVGEPGICNECPVARSLLRCYDWVSVDGLRIMTWMQESSPGENHKTPKEVAKFIKRFDAYKSVEPMEFELGD